MRVLTLFSLLLLLSAGGHSLRLSDNSGNPNSDCIKLLSQNRTPVAITSTRRSFENTLANRDFKRSLWERAIPVPLVLYGETDASWYSPSELFSTDPATLVKSNCRLNIFKRQPRLQEYIAKNEVSKGTGDMSAFYKRVYGSDSKLIEKVRKKHAGLWLIRKVAAIADALKELPDGHLLLWVDTDVVFQKPLDERFLSFAFAHDVATIATPTSKISSVETGIMSFVASNRTRSLANNAVALYLDGGMLALAEECGFDGGKTDSTKENHVCNHLGFNDVKIWHVLLGPHDDAIGKRWWNVPGLNIGWYAVGCRPTGKDIFSWARWSKDAGRYSSGHNLCPGQGNNTSPFNLFEYITHMKGGNGLMTDRRKHGTA
eukprot:gnl/TRDRNA2_/TRDRNA2_177645_c0_seq49.p1 gnl/TRDRNA2_/TRDRNA2_177645_c0~~gnl/TRDRNA2_/TRDRNA2_177645_c0_seq49.p1  ORF type:complete len:373 (+),score=24.31 gnl/TRDRNA2_/TRDRNA2_177645_c0_seq49:33-1151(+)